MEVLLHKDMVYISDKRDGPEKPADPKAYCVFHQFYDHYTEECQTLKHVIQGLVDDYGLSEEMKPSITQLTSAKKGKAKENPELSGRVSSISDPFKKRSRKEAERMKRATERAESYSQSGKTDVLHIRERKPHCLIFTETDESLAAFHNDALVITIILANWEVSRVLIDLESSVQILFREAFDKMHLENKLTPRKFEVVGFNGSRSTTVGEIHLPLTAGGTKSEAVFLVMDTKSPYNAILGRGWLHSVKDVPSTYHQLIKISTSDGIKEIHGEPVVARYCNTVSEEGGTSPDH